MHIVFKSGRKPLGEVELLTAFVTFSLLLGAVLFMLTDGANLKQLMTRIDSFISPNPSWVSDLGVLWVRMVAMIVGALFFILGWRRIIWAMYHLIREIAKQGPVTERNPLWRIIVSSLARQKMYREFESFPNFSPDDMLRELERAKSDEDKMYNASRAGLIDNTQIWRCDWNNLNQLPDHATKILEVSPGKEYKSYLSQAREDFAQLVSDAELDGTAKICFFVSPVQPSILMAASKVIADCNGHDIIELYNRTLTGPLTVQAARDRVSRITHESLDQQVIFAAPLSAFCTAPAMPNENSPNQVFSPVINLLNERQDVLVVEGGANTPVRRGVLYYYNNSTAEECVGRFDLSLLKYFDLCAVSDYDSYKLLLAGQAIPQGPTIGAGDGIITWPPLTDYYVGKSIGAGYYKSGVFELGSTFESRIMLFAEKRVFSDASSFESRLAWAFMRNLNMELLEMNLLYKSLLKTVPEAIFGNYITRNYANMFRMLIT